jgi:general L-amino acid transport system substrate-binding protein
VTQKAGRRLFRAAGPTLIVTIDQCRTRVNKFSGIILAVARNSEMNIASQRNSAAINLSATWIKSLAISLVASREIAKVLAMAGERNCIRDTAHEFAKVRTSLDARVNWAQQKMGRLQKQKQVMREIAIAAAAALTMFGSLGPASAGATLDAVKARGKLICAANGNRAGFSALDSRGQWQGLDVDTCRALAAAALDDAGKVEFLKTTTQTRLTVLQTGEVDVTAANVTWTLTRDAKLGIDFVAPTFYDGQGFMVSRKLGVNSVKEMNGATVCVLPGSTSEKTAAEVAKANGIAFNLVVIENQKELNTAFFSGRCDAHVQTTSGLAANRSAAAADPADYVILPGVYGKDPMGPAVRQGDSQWRDIVNWVIFALFEAEERGVTSGNADEMLKSNDEAIQRLLGVKGNLGDDLGLDERWAYRIVKQVGNYGEIFERNLGKSSPLKLERGVNDLWTRGGLLYSPPFN